jgi:hypothetical protein
MKPGNQLPKNKLSLNKQTVATLDANQLYAVRAGNAQKPDATSYVCTIIILSLTVSCSNC